MSDTVGKNSLHGNIAGSLNGGPAITLQLPTAICLLVGCVLLQVPIYLAARTILGKNLAVAAATLFGMFLPAVVAVLWISPHPGDTFRLRSIPLAGIISAAGAALSFSLLVSGAFEWLLRSGRIPERLIELLEREEMLFRDIFRLQSTLDIAIVGLVLVFIAPLAEELIFRGVFQGSLESAVGHWPGILIAAATFGLLHGRIRFIPVSLLGLLMGYLVMRTNSLPAGIVAHSIHNLAILCLSQFFARHPASRTIPLLTAVFGAVALVVFLGRFHSLTRHHPRMPRGRPNRYSLPSPGMS